MVLVMHSQSTRDDLFHSLIETIHAMRNALLHGETELARNLPEFYEPAFQIVMQVLVSHSAPGKRAHC